MSSSMLTDPPERPGAMNAREPTVVRALEFWKVTLVREEHVEKAPDSRGSSGRSRGIDMGSTRGDV